MKESVKKTKKILQNEMKISLEISKIPNSKAIFVFEQIKKPIESNFDFVKYSSNFGQDKHKTRSEIFTMDKEKILNLYEENEKLKRENKNFNDLNGNKFKKIEKLLKAHQKENEKLLEIIKNNDSIRILSNDDDFLNENNEFLKNCIDKKWRFTEKEVIVELLDLNIKTFRLEMDQFEMKNSNGYFIFAHEIKNNTETNLSIVEIILFSSKSKIIF